MKLNPGDEVIVKASMDRELHRVVVRDLGEVVVIAKDSEIQKAKAEERDPRGIGFKKADVLKVLDRKPASSHGIASRKSKAGD